MTYLLPLPADKRCCDEMLSLAIDQVDYYSVEFVDGHWETNYSGQEPQDGPDSVRLFCSQCGNYYEVPEELA